MTAQNLAPDTDVSLQSLRGAPVLVVGAGIMGAGIAQVAAQAGHMVLLFDARAGAASVAHEKLSQTFDGLVQKGKLSASDAREVLARIRPIESLADVSAVKLVVEAVVERLEVKRSLFKELEALVDASCVLATNTSSISVTAIANGLEHPERLVGMHFFNPVPLMKLVEVVSGLQTARPVAEAIHALSRDWGKVPVHARSTPGFIVNRIARPYYAEALGLLQEQAATPQVLDSCLRSAGFRMGPCELMDLIGHDTNFAVTQSVYEANFFDKRFSPSIIQREMVDGGLLGRKSGRGFYAYPEPASSKDERQTTAPNTVPAHAELVVVGSGAVARGLANALQALGCRPLLDERRGWEGIEVDGLQLRLTDGRTAAEVAAVAAPVVLFDLPLTRKAGASLAVAFHEALSEEQQVRAKAWIQALGWAPLPVKDVPGLIVARTVAMLVNEAADAVHQGVCTQGDADAAMKLGVNYPNGPFEWLEAWDAAAIVNLLDSLDSHYRGERYRVSPWLRQQLHRKATP